MEELSTIELKIPNLGEAEATEIIEINIKPGDKVKLEMSPYDLTKGRITYRY